MKHRKLSIIAMAALTLATVGLSPLARAESTDDSNMTMTHTESEKMSMHEEVAKRRAELEQKIQTAKDSRSTRLSEQRQKVCTTKVEKINQILQKRSTQATKHLEVFNKISERVQTFVKEKNLTVENYDSLVATINDKQAAAQAAIETNTATTFSCDTASSEKPLMVPRTTIDAVRDALKDYRTAIKDLIVNVKSSANKVEPTAAAPATTSGEVSQ